MSIHRGSPGASGVAGHSLIELMIAILVGLLLVLAAFQVLTNFEGHKRTTTAMNDALQSGNFGLYSLDTLMRSAGSGLVQTARYAYGCPLNFTSSGGQTASAGQIALPSPFTSVLTGAGAVLRLAPAVIFPNSTASGSDVLLLMSGGGGFGEAPVRFTSAASGSNLVLLNTIGFSPKEWVLVSEGSVNPPTTPDCMISQVAADYVPETAAHSNGNVVLPLIQSSVGSATLGTYSADALATGLGIGTAASFMLYGVGSDNSLYSVDLLNSDLSKAQLVSNDIVTLRAVYGVDTDNNGALDTWVTPTNSAGMDYSPAALLNGSAAASARIRTIKAIRIAVVIRSSLNERADAGNKNTETGNAFNAGSFHLFSSLPAAVQVTWNVAAGQENYRYRELEGTIPLRNASF